MERNKFQSQYIFIFLLALIVFIPFQSLMAELLLAHTQLKAETVFWLVHWYEPIIIVFFLFSLFSVPIYKVKSAVFVLLLLFFGLISLLFTPLGFKEGLEGFRFVLFPLLVFIVALAYSDKNIEKIQNIYFYLGLFIALWALGERILPENYWVLYKIVPDNSVFGGLYRAGSVRQASSLIGAPNQLASYLLPAFFISLFTLKKNINKFWPYLFSLVIFLAILLTFSRSAILGLFIGVLIFITLYTRSKFLKIASWLVVSVGAIMIVYLYQKGPPNIQSFLAHGTSQNFHQEAYLNFVNTFSESYGVEKIFGHGVGTAGPIVIKYNSGIIPESWYLQLLFELGIVGLLLWFLNLFFLFKETFKREPSLFLSLLAVSITALFLHTWADNPALTYSIFILLGINIAKEKTDGNNSN